MLEKIGRDVLFFFVVVVVFYIFYEELYHKLSKIFGLSIYFT